MEYSLKANILVNALYSHFNMALWVNIFTIFGIVMLIFQFNVNIHDTGHNMLSKAINQ